MRFIVRTKRITREREHEGGEEESADRSSIIGGGGVGAAMGALRFWYPNHAAVLYSSIHMGRLTKVKTLYSIMTEKQRKMAYKTRT